MTEIIHFSSEASTLKNTDRKERQRQTDRQTDRQTGRQTGRQTDRQADRQTDFMYYRHSKLLHIHYDASITI